MDSKKRNGKTKEENLGWASLWCVLCVCCVFVYVCVVCVCVMQEGLDSDNV